MKKATTKTKTAFAKLSTDEFGRRVKAVREDLLEIKQAELASKIGIMQEALSRLENGIGGNIIAVFNIINYLNSKGYYGGMIFKEPFDINNLKINNQEFDKTAIQQQIKQTINDLVAANNKASTQLMKLLDKL